MRTSGTRTAGIGVLILAPLLIGATAAVASGWLERSTAAPPARTVRIRIHFSFFEPQEIDVEPGQTIRFVVENADPIDHEFIVGDEEMQQVHETGSEAHHTARPGEISIAAGATVVTTYTFPEQAGGLVFGCHLPGHYAYGMRGEIRIA